MSFDARTIERFWSHVEKTDGCWNWTSARSKCGKGYGVFNANDKSLGAHRVSFEIANGPIPSGLHVLHSCDNKICVRPDHLHLGTHKQNMEEAAERNRFNPHYRGIQFCKWGHEFTPENTIIRSNGTGRKCRMCHRASVRKRKRKLRILSKIINLYRTHFSQSRAA